MGYRCTSIIFEKLPKVNNRLMVENSPGTDVMIFKIFSPKNSAKNLKFLTQNKAKFCKILITTLVFEKNANFFAEKCQKSQKIVIITSTPGCERDDHFFRPMVPIT
jgi:hypothetical protein